MKLKKVFTQKEFADARGLACHDAAPILTHLVRAGHAEYVPRGEMLGYRWMHTESGVGSHAACPVEAKFFNRVANRFVCVICGNVQP